MQLALRSEGGNQQPLEGPRRLDSLLGEAFQLEDGRGCEPDLGFLARALIQATLPHSDRGGNEFVRRNGRFTLSLLAPADVGLPYGRYPRLILAYLCSEAVRRSSRHLELGNHFSSFCRSLGLVPTSGPRGSLRALRIQMQRLFASTFQCVYHDEPGGQHSGEGFLVVDRRCLWWEAPAGDTGLDAGSWVELSERFFREATESPVPVDLRTLQSLRSPFEIDIYVWLTWRLYRLSKPLTIPWTSLVTQFGCDYRNPRHFKRRFLRYLANVLRYYPAARVGQTKNGLVLKPSRPHLATKSRQGQPRDGTASARPPRPAIPAAPPPRAA